MAQLWQFPKEVNPQRTWLIDIEADGLLDTISQIWCVVCKNIHTGEVKSFHPPEEGSNCKKFYADFLTWVSSQTGPEWWVGHNILSYDIVALNRIIGTQISVEKCFDTLIMSKLANPKRLPGHGLGAWGQALGFPKMDWDDFSQFSFDMLTYCQNDVEVNHKVLLKLQEELSGFSQFSIRLEHRIRHIANAMERRGFYLDQQKTHLLYVEMKEKADSLEKILKGKFGVKVKPLERTIDGAPRIRTPKTVVQKIWTGNYTISPTSGRKVKEWREEEVVSPVGLRLLGLPDETLTDTVAGAFCLVNYEEFNPGSVPQIKERLSDLGWKPTVFKKPTVKQVEAGLRKGLKKHQIQGAAIVDEETMAEFAEVSGIPEIKLLSEYLFYRSRYTTAEQWLDLVGPDSRIHGKVDTLGAKSHRMTHTQPNTANLSSVSVDKEGNPIKGYEGRYGFELRDCFTVDDPTTRCIVGCDASGIQLRALAHYMGDEDYIREVCEGDVHTRNMIAAGLKDRPTAKTYIYAFLLNAGDGKIAQIIEGTVQQAKDVKERFLDAIPSLKRLKQEQVIKARTGWFYGLDGRKVIIPSEHLCMAQHLQSFEAIVMKYALYLWTQEKRKRSLDAQLVAIVHDEAQFDCLKEHAEETGELMKGCITKAGVILKSKCPLAGEYRVGSSWANSH